MPYSLFHCDCVEWLRQQPANSIEAICTDPPYGLVEFSKDELVKLRAGKGGIWRIPPKIGGSERAPLPRFTVLSEQERQSIEAYFLAWGQSAVRVLVPGAHVVIASNPTIAHYVQMGMAEAGVEVRGTIIRTYWTFRGGDRPKLAEKEFPEVSVTPRGAYEPWLLFRKPISEKTVSDNLRKWKTGALRRPSVDSPFQDVIASSKTPQSEEAIADHPCLKPQRFLRQMIHALLPLGEGCVLDPFMGSGSTVAAAIAIGYRAIGIELDDEYFEMARHAVPRLAALPMSEDEFSPSFQDTNTFPEMAGLFQLA
jgi:site-specific DNA-methyltransferase (adenine-specific)